MDLLVFIYVFYPTKVRIVEKECAKEEAKLLVSTVRCVVPLLPVAPARAESELEASVEKLFDEVGSTEQVDSASEGGQDAEIEFVTTAKDTVTGSVAAERPKRPRKKRSEATNASGSSHPPKKLILSVESGVLAMPTLSFVTSSMFAMPRREDRTLLILLPEPIFVPLVFPVVDKVIPQVQQFIFQESTSADTIKPNVAGPSYPPGKELSFGSREVDYENLYEVFVPHWNVPNDALLDDFNTSREFIDHLAHPVLFAQICDMDYKELFIEFNIGTAHQAYLSVEVRMRTEYCLTKVAEAARLYTQVSATEAAKKDFDVPVTSLKSQNDSLVDQVHVLKSTCSSLHDQRWLLTHGIKLFLVKCLNSSDYLTALGYAINRAIEKGMQSGLAAGIDHDKECRNLTDVAAYNPDAEADFNSALVPIHRSEDQVVLSETSLSFSLSVSHSRMERLRENIAAQRENIAAQRSALIGVWTPLSEPLYVQSLMGKASTSGGVPAAAVTTTALSTTFTSTSFFPPISTDDYEIVGVDGQEDFSKFGVYVDDLVIKSRTKQEVIRDIEETFKTLRKINMELNPKKCTFGMREGTFLRYKANADGLKKPMLTASEEKEELIIYLAATKEAISVVLMTKRDGKQMHVYFVSCALQGLEINYTPMEKLILALTEDISQGTNYSGFHCGASRIRPSGYTHREQGRTSEPIDIVYGWIIVHRRFWSWPNTYKSRRNGIHICSKVQSHKDASVEDIMNLLRLEGPLADAPGMSDLQHDIKQLRVPIHRSEDQVASTSGGVPAAAVTTTALSTTFTSTSFVPPISTDDYEIVGVDGQEGACMDG
nr:reverse transcriptase domain-containing protein [Tanacetum cinerariifolium]